jgi:hypothetical protein
VRERDPRNAEAPREVGYRKPDLAEYCVLKHLARMRGFVHVRHRPRPQW